MLKIVSMYDGLIATVKAMSNVPYGQFDNLIKITKPQDFRANQSFIEAGEIPTKFAFNRRGLFRYFYIDEKGNEYTKGFFPDNTIISSYSAMIQQRGSYFTIEALENASALIIDYQDWKRLVEEHPCWNSFLISLLEKGYITKESRERELLIYDAETRYKLFLENFPQLDKRIKQHYIASFLGITPVALSRIRKKLGLVNLG